jgi:hypothetical protein
VSRIAKERHWQYLIRDAVCELCLCVLCGIALSHGLTESRPPEPHSGREE